MDISTRSPTAVKDEGRAARYRGDPASSNPYPEATDEHDIWQRSWEQSDEITGDDTPGDDPNKRGLPEAGQEAT